MVVLFAAMVTACGLGPEPAPVNLPRADPSAIPPTPRLALVLSSGGPRGFAHIGVLKVLDEAGIRPDFMVGSSSGAFVAVLYAADPSPRALEARALALSGADVFDYSLVQRRITGTGLQSWFNQAVNGRQLDQLKRPVAILATRSDTQRPVAFTRGDAGLAVRASSAVLGSFAPVEFGGVTYVDGDVAAPLPIDVARSFGARKVIAVDVAQDVGRAPAPIGSPANWTQEALDRRVKIDRELSRADVVIAPTLPYITGFSADYRKMAIATGEAAARAVLPQLRTLVAR
ncbi:MAG: patatin-like phospholipase family protein [Casimicrobiaceae bacterium]